MQSPWISFGLACCQWRAEPLLRPQPQQPQEQLILKLKIAASLVKTLQPSSRQVAARHHAVLLDCEHFATAPGV